jgi:hypothetical protein
MRSSKLKVTMRSSKLKVNNPDKATTDDRGGEVLFLRTINQQQLKANL